MTRGRPAARRPASMLAAGPAAAGSGHPGGPVAAEGFEAARERTGAALLALAAHLGALAAPGAAGAERGAVGAEAVAAAAEGAARAAAELSPEGFAWSGSVGLGFVLPSGALQCGPLARCVARDGLRPPAPGGPAIPTHPGLLVAPAPPCGYGVFTTQELRKGERLGEYTGEVRSYDVWVEEIKSRKRAARGSDHAVPFIREELYAAWTGDGPAGKGVVVDAFALGNTMRFINCSCSPNCSFRNLGKGSEGHSRLEVVTKRIVMPWEQLSVDYGWYFDDDTLGHVRCEATQRYRADLPWLRQLACTGRPPPPSPAAGALLAVAGEAQGAGEHGAVQQRSFLERFLDPGEVKACLEGAGAAAGGAPAAPLPDAGDWSDVPEAFWPLYEVVGAEAVGIPCRCGLDPSLNPGGHCSGIIGRPLQAVLKRRHGAPSDHPAEGP